MTEPISFGSAQRIEFIDRRNGWVLRLFTYSLDATGRTTYTFDADGNQQLVVEPNGNRTTNTWDYENQTTLVELPTGARVTMSYNADNRRVRKET